MANVTKPMALDETLQNTNTALSGQNLKLEGIITKLQGIIAALAGNNPIIGDTDISSIADGTVTGAIDEINTTLEELSISDLSDTNISNPSDGEVIKYDATNQKWVNGSSGSKHNYSTTEQVIGTWIDGKPIYEKVIPVTTTAQSYRLDVSALNIDYVVFIKVRIKNVNPLSQSSCDYPYWYSNTDWFRYYFSADNKLIIFESGRDFSYGNGYVILQYTKTTD